MHKIANLCFRKDARRVLLGKNGIDWAKQIKKTENLCAFHFLLRIKLKIPKYWQRSWNDCLLFMRNVLAQWLNAKHLDFQLEQLHVNIRLIPAWARIFNWYLQSAADCEINTKPANIWHANRVCIQNADDGLQQSVQLKPRFMFQWTTHSHESHFTTNFFSSSFLSVLGAFLFLWPFLCEWLFFSSFFFLLSSFFFK